MVLLEELVVGFAEAMTVVDGRAPVALNARTKQPYSAGIAPHPETRTTELVAAELVRLVDGVGEDEVQLEVPYPGNGRARCDLVVGPRSGPEWAVEVKMLRMLGDNGKLNDNMLMHILSPYAAHRSAVTDCEKLAVAGIAKRQALLIYAYDYDDWPAEPVLAAFEVLARLRVGLGERLEHWSGALIHPVHRRAVVAAWEIWPNA